MNKVDALFLYNEREKQVEYIDRELKSLGYQTFFWRRDIKYGGSITAGEKQHLTDARKVIVFLGEKGWGDNHRRMLHEAQELSKDILPVLIGKATQESLQDEGALFLEYRYVDMTQINTESLQELAKALGQPAYLISSQRFDKEIQTIIDGNEEQRFNVLKSISELPFALKVGIASRLLEEIQHFNPGMDKRPESAKRDPNKVPSIRSWMFSCLIASHPENPKSKELILKHLDADYDSETNVRFWILAELFHRNVSYIEEALQITSQNRFGLVYLLAKTISKPKDKQLIESHRKLLESGENDERWEVLRVLRIIAIPELAGSVVSLFVNADSERTAYDALHALANPTMLESAFPLLIVKPGTAVLLDRIASILANSDKSTVRTFVTLLEPFPEAEIRRELNRMMEDPERRALAKSIKRSLASHRDDTSSYRNSRTGFASDEIDVDKDYIDIKQDVKILSAAMLSKEIKPPLAIGLFGNWGTGKSFFMQSLQKECNSLQKSYAYTAASPFHTDIVQIDFNAWNYSDSNLWASLVNHIFEQLSEFIIPKITEQESIDVFLSMISELEDGLDTSRTEEEELKRSREEKELELAKLEDERVNKPVNISEIDFAVFKKMLSEIDREKLNASLKEMGFPAANDAITDLDLVLVDIRSTQGRFLGLVSSMLRSTNKFLIAGFLFFILIVIPLLGWFFKEEISSAVAAISVAMLGFTSTMGTIIIALKSALKRVKDGVAIIESSKKRIEEQLELLRSVPSEKETELKVEIADIKSKEANALVDIKTNYSLLEDKKSELSEFRRSKSLATFLADRSIAEDYKAHLGIMSTIRKDLDSLLNKLTFDVGEGKKINRIILYIDDLDRCPPDKVIEVLQAVHLLLSYKLFVVVVGVDPIWLVKSLKKRFTVNNESSQDFLGTSPQHFLEKIFQIPFNLKQMSEQGFTNLITNLMSPEKPNQVSKVDNNDELALKIIEPVIKNTLEGAENIELEDSPTALESEDNHTENELKFGGANFDVFEEALAIQEWEVQFASELFVFIKSPRAATRFANLYRLLKASVSERDLDDFEGTIDQPGNFQVPMVLLAILAGNVLISTHQLANIFTSGEDGKISILGDNSIKILTDEQILVLNQLLSDPVFPADTALLENWLPKVGRFSLNIFLLKE